MAKILKKRRTYVIGDIHGNAQALVDVLGKCPIKKYMDHLIILGDVCDGHPHTKECVEILLQFPNRTFVLGNHDSWFLTWLDSGIVPWVWEVQGGAATLMSYGGRSPDLVPETHKEFFRSAVPYLEMKEMLFVHGGLDPERPVSEQATEELIWDRSIIKYAQEREIPNYKRVFIGHTSTLCLPRNKHTISKDLTKPQTFNNLTILDTGAGAKGKLTIMDTKLCEKNPGNGKYWQSEATL